METSASMCQGVKDFETYHILEEKVGFFRKYLNLFRTGHEGEVILEPSSEENRANIVVLRDSPHEFFYIHFPIVHNLKCLYLLSILNMRLSQLLMLPISK